MAKKRKRKGNKSAAIRQYLMANPNASAADVISALKAQGIKVTSSNVSTIKWSMKKTSESGASPAEPATPGKPGSGRRGRRSAGETMSKSQAVREFLTANPEMGPKAASESLRARGLDVSPTHVSNIKFSMKKQGPAAAPAEVPAADAAAGEADTYQFRHYLLPKSWCKNSAVLSRPAKRSLPWLNWHNWAAKDFAPNKFPLLRDFPHLASFRPTAPRRRAGAETGGGYPARCSCQRYLADPAAPPMIHEQLNQGLPSMSG